MISFIKMPNYIKLKKKKSGDSSVEEIDVIEEIGNK